MFPRGLVNLALRAGALQIGGTCVNCVKQTDSFFCKKKVVLSCVKSVVKCCEVVLNFVKLCKVVYKYCKAVSSCVKL